METLKSTVQQAMAEKRLNIESLNAKREKALDKLSKIHTEIGYAKADLSKLESDFKSLHDNRPLSNNSNCGMGTSPIYRDPCKMNY